MKHDPILLIRSLLQSMGRTEPCTLTPLPPSGSDRKYYHIGFDDASLPVLMAFYNPIVEENRAQVAFTSHFRKLGMRVPDILAKDGSETVFIVEYLGNLTLFDLASKGITDEVIAYYQQALTDLVHFQIDGIKDLNMEVAYPVSGFDRQSILWDLNYFKYCFLKPAGISFNERLLEADFMLFTDELSQSEPNFFCYRDFQARNIMIYQNKPWYVDFQGGRRGPLPYDVVSLLHQVKANLSEDIKDSLFQYYLTQLERVAPLEVIKVQSHYNDFVYFRLMQVLGAYGFRGLVERKAHFLQSIPFAARALSLRLKHHPLLINLPEIKQVLAQIIQKFQTIDLSENENLTVTIYSFSYKKKGVPVDLTGNGGGYVFDCRGLPNPHRISTLRDLTGKDLPIVEFMNAQPTTKVFLHNAFALVDLSIKNYLDRGFKNLQVSFGCTGGRHRSVYSAVQLQQHIREQFPQVGVLLQHLEINSQLHD